MSRVDISSNLFVGPQSKLERELIKKFLESKNLSPSDLASLPVDEAQKVMRQACAYASLKLAEVESKAQFRQKIHGGN